MSAPFERVRDLIDDLGAVMSKEDWIEFLGSIEDDCRDKRITAEQELEDEEREPDDEEADEGE